MVLRAWVPRQPQHHLPTGLPTLLRMARMTNNLSGGVNAAVFTAKDAHDGVPGLKAYLRPRSSPTNQKESA